MMNVLIALLFVVGGSVVHAIDEHAKTDAVSVEFMGSSGGIKIFPNSGDGAWIMVQQNKLEEVDADGKGVNGPGKKINMAGQNMGWTALTTDSQGAGRVVYSTSFTKVVDDVTFTLTAHLARESTTVEEPVPCNNCTDGSTGNQCQNATSSLCAAVDADNLCPADFTRCTESVDVTRDELKFSVVVQGWTFDEASNRLSYGIDVKSKNGGGAEAELDDVDGTTDKKVALDGGAIVAPTTAVIKGGEVDKEVDVGVTLTLQGSKQVLSFDFPSFGEGEALYYDPDLSVDSLESAAGAPHATALASMIAAMLLAALLF